MAACRSPDAWPLRPHPEPGLPPQSALPPQQRPVPLLLTHARAQADRAEAEFRTAQRHEQIERAQKLLFEETDRVKTLHSKMLTCDVLQVGRGARWGRSCRCCCPAGSAALAVQPGRCCEAGSHRRGAYGGSAEWLVPPVGAAQENEALAAQRRRIAELQAQRDRRYHDQLVAKVQVGAASSCCCPCSAQAGRLPRDWICSGAPGMAGGPSACLHACLCAPQAGDEEEQAKQAAAKGRAQQQKEVQMQQLEELKARIRKERCVRQAAGALAAAAAGTCWRGQGRRLRQAVRHQLRQAEAHTQRRKPRLLG